MSYWLAPWEASRAIRDAEREQFVVVQRAHELMMSEATATFLGPACAYCGTVGSPTAKRRCRECGAPAGADQ